MKLTTKITVTMVIIVLFAVVVTTFLNYSKYQATLSDLVRSRFVVVALDLKHTIESSVNLGMALEETENIQDVIDRLRGKHEQIRSLAVFRVSAGKGAAVFDTERAGVGRSVPDHWMHALDRSEDGVWHAVDADAFVVGVSVVNSFDKLVAGVALRYAKAYEQDKVAAMFRRLSAAGAVVFAVVAGAAFAGVFYFFRPISASFARMTHSLQQLFSEEEPPLTEANAATEEEARFVRFQRKTHAVIEHLLEADEEMHNAEREG